MSTVHELKTWPPYFAALWDGRKTFEVREVKDRLFGVGDCLHLREFDPCEACSGRGFFVLKQDSGHMSLFRTKKNPCNTCHGSKGVYTKREMTAKVTYVMDGGQFGVSKGHVVMGIKIAQRANTPSGRQRIPQ